jgi:2Fe-2S ferredoxin
MLYRIHFLPSERTVRVVAGTPLLEAARRAGLPVAEACQGDGACARCGMRILSGGEGLSPESEGERAAKLKNRVDGRLRLSCQVRADRDMTVTAPYW